MRKAGAGQKLRSGQLNQAAQTATEIGLNAVRERERQHFGLQGFESSVGKKLDKIDSGIKGELSSIKEKVIVIEQTAQNVWDVVRRSPILGGTATVERKLTNIGNVKISAEPHLESTIHYIQSEKPVWDGALIEKLSKSTGLEEREIQMFGKPPKGTSIRPTLLRLEIPCTKGPECTEYISTFLKWADSIYFASMPKSLLQ